MKRQRQFEAFNEDEEQEYVSKTQLKKEADDLKKLGLEILDLSAKNRASLPLDNELNEALDTASKINRKKDGFRRQIQFIGKLLRKQDVAPIELALAKINAAHRGNVDKFHEFERIRDDILSRGDDGINAFLSENPQGDRQKLRHLVRTAKKETAENKPPAASRELFKYIRSLIE